MVTISKSNGVVVNALSLLFTVAMVIQQLKVVPPVLSVSLTGPNNIDHNDNDIENNNNDLPTSSGRNLSPKKYYGYYGYKNYYNYYGKHSKKKSKKGYYSYYSYYDKKSKKSYYDSYYGYKKKSKKHHKSKKDKSHKYEKSKKSNIPHPHPDKKPTNHPTEHRVPTETHTPTTNESNDVGPNGSFIPKEEWKTTFEDAVNAGFLFYDPVTKYAWYAYTVKVTSEEELEEEEKETGVNEEGENVVIEESVTIEVETIVIEVEDDTVEVEDDTVEVEEETVEVEEEDDVEEVSNENNDDRENGFMELPVLARSGHNNNDDESDGDNDINTSIDDLFDMSMMCSSNPECFKEGLVGSCCPSQDGIYLDCCDTRFCERNSKCEEDGLTGVCCPTMDGVFLDCCDSHNNNNNDSNNSSGDDDLKPANVTMGRICPIDTKNDGKILDSLCIDIKPSLKYSTSTSTEIVSVQACYLQEEEGQEGLHKLAVVVRDDSKFMHFYDDFVGSRLIVYDTILAGSTDNTNPDREKEIVDVEVHTPNWASLYGEKHVNGKPAFSPDCQTAVYSTWSNPNNEETGAVMTIATSLLGPTISGSGLATKNELWRIITDSRPVGFTPTKDGTKLFSATNVPPGDKLRTGGVIQLDAKTGKVQQEYGWHDKNSNSGPSSLSHNAYTNVVVKEGDGGKSKIHTYHVDSVYGVVKFNGKKLAKGPIWKAVEIDDDDDDENDESVILRNRRDRRKLKPQQNADYSFRDEDAKNALFVIGKEDEEGNLVGVNEEEEDNAVALDYGIGDNSASNDEDVDENENIKTEEKKNYRQVTMPSAVDDNDADDNDTNDDNTDDEQPENNPSVVIIHNDENGGAVTSLSTTPGDDVTAESLFTAYRPAVSATTPDDDDDDDEESSFVYYGCYGSVVLESGEKGANVDAISFRASDGEADWSTTVHDGVRSRCARITNDIVRGGSLAAVQRREEEEEGDAGEQSKGGIYVARRTAVQAFDESDGTLLWHYPTTDYGDESSFFASTSSPKFALVDDRTVLVVDGPGNIVSLRTTEDGSTPAPVEAPEPSDPPTRSPSTPAPSEEEEIPTEPTFKPNSPVSVPTEEPTVSPREEDDSSAHGRSITVSTTAAVATTMILSISVPLVTSFFS